MKWIMLAAGVLILSGCSYNKTNVRNEAEADKYDPAATARIRLYSSPEKLAGFVPGKTCKAYYNHPVNGELQGMIWTREHDRNQRYILWRDRDLLGVAINGAGSQQETSPVSTSYCGNDGHGRYFTVTP